MLYDLFTAIFGMSITAAIVILVVLPISTMLKSIKAPAVIRYALWAVILFRLLVSVSFTSEISLFNLGFLQQPIQIAENISEPELWLPEQNVNIVNMPAPTLPESPPTNDGRTSALPNSVPALIWLGGALLLLGYHAISYIRLRRTLATAVCVERNIFHSDRVRSPFVCGLLHPRIYLPFGLREKEHNYILLHEQIHVKRRDYLLKPLWLCACCLHWFNPLVWLAFSLMCEDMELSCDEAVLKQLGDGIKLDYSRLLIALAAHRPACGSGLPGFGQHKTKARVNHILNYKKPLAGAVALAVAVVALTACALATNAPPQQLEAQELPKLTDEELQHFVAERLTVYQTMAADSTFTQTGDAAPPLERQLGWPYDGTIVGNYGIRYLGYHSGVDITGPQGGQVVAAEAGTVIFAEWLGTYGNLIRLDHGDDLETWYGDLSAYAVEAGDVVECGDVIGYIGTTGRSGEPQVHFEVRYKSVPYNPLNYLTNAEEQLDT